MRRALTVLLVLFVGIIIASTAAAQPVKRVEYYHLDALGSVRAVTDQQGHEIARHDYLPFGEEWPQATFTLTPLFTGKPRDVESALDYFGARYYASRTGRFTTVDPLLNIAEALIDPQGWNRYAYVQNRPHVLMDPDGRGPVPLGRDWAQQVATLRRKYEQASGLRKVWLGVRLALEMGSMLPTPGAIALEGSALARSGMALEESARAFTGWAAGVRILEGEAVGVAFRKPDLLSQAANALGEVKNAATVARTLQLRDYIEYAAKTGMQLNLFVRANTKFTTALLESLNKLGHFQIYKYVDGQWVNVTAQYVLK